MKNRLIVSLLATLSICSCQVNELTEVFYESKQFVAFVDDSFDGGETRTSLHNGNVLWKQGDKISIFAGSTLNECYQVSDDSDGQTSATLNKVLNSGSESGNAIGNNVAFYPYAPLRSISNQGYGYVFDHFFPATQNYATDSFGNGAFPMVAVTGSTDDMKLKFKNLLGGLKLQLKGTARIASIRVSGNNGEGLCGHAQVTVPISGSPSINLWGSYMTVVLDCGSGVQLNEETSTSFIIALPPMTMEGGFTVVVIDTEGKRMEIKTTKSQTINRSTLLKMPPVEYVGIADELDYENEPFTITSHGSTGVAIVSRYSPDAISLEYKKGDGVWTEYTIVDFNDFYYNNQVIGDPIELADGETLQFRAGEGGNETFSQSGSYASTMQRYYKVVVVGSGTVDASGNIMSLVDRDMQRTTLDSYMFHGLFESCTSLVDASKLKLPATVLSYDCYKEMFGACMNLIAAPELPATTLASNCYYGMFDSCQSLTTAPNLPATELQPSCYDGMFAYCRSLTTAPELPATKLASGCYEHMFIYCENLSTAPALPAVNLKSRCYTEMFKRCSNLNYVKAYFVKDPQANLSNDIYNWLDGVSYTGTFVKSSAANWDVRGSSGIPEGWTVEYDDIDLGLPSLGAPEVQNVEYKSATLRSTVKSDGGHAITSCGFYYGKSENAINSRLSVTGYTSGDITREITNLNSGTTYYIKAFATNEVGTVESDVISFTTMATIGTLNGHQWVDIGIRKSQYDTSIEPGSAQDRRIVFAKQNIGANSQYDTGYFFRGNELYGWNYSGSTTSSYGEKITSANLVQVDNEGNALHAFQYDDFEWWDEESAADEFYVNYTKGNAIDYYYGSGWSYMPDDLIRKLYCHTSWYSSLPLTVNATYTLLTGLTLSFAFSSTGVKITNSALGTSIFLPLAGSICGRYSSCYYRPGSGLYWGSGAIEAHYGGGTKRVWLINKDSMGSNWDDESENYKTWEYGWETNGSYTQDAYVGCPLRAVAELPL